MTATKRPRHEIEEMPYGWIIDGNVWTRTMLSDSVIELPCGCTVEPDTEWCSCHFDEGKLPEYRNPLFVLGMI